MDSAVTLIGGGAGRLPAIAAGAVRSPTSRSSVCFDALSSAVVKSSTFMTNRAGNSRPLTSWKSSNVVVITTSPRFG